MDTPRLDFIVMAYPRSGTTWLANLLTTDRSLCLHDPFGDGPPETWQHDYRRRGISCTVAPLLPDWTARYDCPIAVIHRDRADCDASLRAIGLEPFTMTRWPRGTAPALHVEFDDLWNEASARQLWAHLLPGLRFDALRYRLLRDMRVQPHPRKHIPDKTAMTALIESGELRMEN